MGEREWKPGEVALRTGPNGAQTLSLVVQVRRGFGDCENEHGYGPHWHHANGGWNQIPDDPKWGTYRPLVVIDPEDREQVERLADIFCARPSSGWVEQMQAALREFADPKPPLAEPKGLGAVVEDIEGVRWTRVESGEAETRNPWYPADCDFQPDAWFNVCAVKVLSEGVES